MKMVAALPPTNRPVVYLFICNGPKGETEPAIDVITPIKGPAAGGTRIKIEGKDFRTAMQGYDNKNLKVFLGGQEATAESR